MKLATVDRLVRCFVPSVWLDRISGYDVFISYAQSDGTLLRMILYRYFM